MEDQETFLDHRSRLEGKNLSQGEFDEAFVPFLIGLRSRWVSY